MTVPYTVPVNLISRTSSTTDGHGNSVQVDSAPVTVQGVFSPGGTSEVNLGRDVVTTKPTVYLPDTADVTALSAVQVNGVTYEVDGTPAVWGQNPFTGWRPPLPIVVQLKDVEG